MKRFIFLVLLICFTLPVLGQKKLREIDLRINGIGSGTSYSAAIRKLGKPLQSKTTKFKASDACSAKVETHLTINYSGLEITFLGSGRGHNLSAYRIEINSPKWIVSGIKIGAEPKDVQTRFGEPNSKAENIGETVFYYVMKDNLGVVNFYFQSNKLKKC